MKFKINEKIPGDKIHARGGPYRKGVIYDSVAMKLPDHVVAELLSLTMGKTGPAFFLPADDVPNAEFGMRRN